jgi:hypothetical protein
MKLLYLTLLGLLLLSYQSAGKKSNEYDDNDFAEFEDDGLFLLLFFFQEFGLLNWPVLLAKCADKGEISWITPLCVKQK